MSCLGSSAPASIATQSVLSPMNSKLLSCHPKLLLVNPSLSSFRTFKFPRIILNQILQHRHLCKRLRYHVKCSANDNNETTGGPKNWEKWIPTNLFAAEKVFGAIAGTTSSPLAQYISSPTTFLHTVDPRIKMAWLLALVILPARSDTTIRLWIVIYLALLSVWVQPTEVWMIFQSASLCLTTTTSEQLAFALQWFIRPLSRLGVPVSEVILTLLLSLRFINLVFDEVRNVALGIISRRIRWKELTTLETIDVFFSYIRRIFKNIYSHAEQISQAMIVRGFRGDCDSHKVLLTAGASTLIANIVSLFCLVGLIGATTLSR
ncbi:protein ABCI12, chloroplastic isoform X2 [Primulina eburnea]|uniref:protein ABCI12, chloroplastic isoform X2 n=1 Tax=Primulina eburnea TaxID=1245227 RepID=UPI003C6C131C